METTINSAVENLMLLQPLLYMNLIKPSRSKIPLPPGAYFVMSVLKRHDFLSMSDISRKLSMPKPHVTAQIDKLIAEGLVERFFDPEDRRIINITITEKGREHLKQIKQYISENLRNKLLNLDKEHLDILADASQKVKDILIMLNDNDCDYCKSHQKEKTNL